jgi:thiosulfate/3-mercaptopyruvate sulfurtransferase
MLERIMPMNEVRSGSESAALVETDWLERHLGDPDLRILECTVILTFRENDATIESGYEDWAQCHIPGSRFVDLIKEISDPNARIRFTLPSPARFAEAMSRHGVGDGTQVVLYDRARTMWAARVWWMLQHFGFERAAVLNGGWTKWVAEGRPVSRDMVSFPPARFEPKIHNEWFVNKKEVVEALGSHRHRLIYALDGTKYEGRKIPGSQMVTAENLLDPETGAFLSLEEIRRRFAVVNALDGCHVITYCGSGIAASLDAFALHVLGKYEVSVYDGSLLEWILDETLPFEKW